MYERFRLTPSKTRVALVLGAIIPLFTYSVAKYSDVSHLRFTKLSTLCILLAGADDRETLLNF